MRDRVEGEVLVRLNEMVGLDWVDLKMRKRKLAQIPVTRNKTTRS